MNVKINNPSQRRIKILIAPLDWGLGHATRCIPIIKELLNHKCEVWVAAAGAQKTLLKEEFPFLLFVELPGYGIKYGKNRALTICRLLFSIPKILIRIKRENAWLRAFQTIEAPDAVLSDNRYGLHAPGLFSVFITHQLHIMTPFGRFADRLLQGINYRYIRRFSRCWIPDVEGVHSLAGQLSHPARMPVIATRYIGWLSRLDEGASASTTGPADLPTDHPADPAGLLILLSGPEPQRTILEQMVLRQATSWSGPITLIRGLPDGGRPINPPNNMVIHDHLPAKTLATTIREADIVLSRAGYSTVMDLVKLGKKAIFIPTPGQTEQEYLGAYLADRRLALCIRQSAFFLPQAMAAARDFPFVDGRSGHDHDDQLRREIQSMLEGLRSSIQ